ncbi:hypothetical protein B0J17DRAFT_46228 [Rhizoctonia solani]|nr:hypothetical protein B0J17DRAFT_46228 [Rhizoctonia solani]
MRWWNKTFQMLDYVEYIDLPVSTSGVLGVPALGDGLLGGPTMRYSRVSVGERHELVKREPLVRSLHKIKTPKSKKRPRSFKERKDKMGVNPRFCIRLAVKQEGNQGSTLGAQSSPRHIFKVYWEDFAIHPKIPGDYTRAIGHNLWQKSVLLYTPRSVVASPQWPTRNRALQLIAYIQYTYRLPSEIFFLAIHLLDRYIASYQQLARLNGAQWDLVGLSCLWLAWKYENYTSVPPLDDLIVHSELVRITRDEVIFAEWTVRRTIGLDLSYTSPLVWMRLGLLACPCTRETKYVARFLADISTTVHLCYPPAIVGFAIVWLACVLTDVPLPENAQHCIHREKAANRPAAMLILMGVLYMPRPIERPREQALFYKWTLPIVSNVAGWCQQTLESVWPNQTDCGPLLHFYERLLDLGVRVRSQPFELGPGPCPEHPLFEG